jgi:outer membrane protein TolC
MRLERLHLFTCNREMKTNTTLLTLLLASSICVRTQAEPSTTTPAHPGALAKLVETSFTNNPAIAAAHARWERYLHERDALDGFFDPELRASGGRHEAPTTIPESLRGSTLPSDRYGLQGSISAAIRPGAYVSVGTGSYSLIGDDPTIEGRSRNSGGARLDIPLLRNRGFAPWLLEKERANYTATDHGYLLLDGMQHLRREIAISYVGGLQASADALESSNATRRAEALLDEASQRVTLDVLPQYQIHSASMEAALRKEEQRLAAQLIQEQVVELNRLCGIHVSHWLQLDAGQLITWATHCMETEVSGCPVETACMRRGDVLALSHRLFAEQATLAHIQQSRKSDLSLSFSAGWWSDDGHDPSALDDADDSQFGSEIALTWRRPLRRTESHAKQRAQEARIREIEEQLRQITQRVEAEIATTTARLASARERLILSQQAVDAAQLALDSERERFRLGEGRSRNVLDAQKDLTGSIRRRNGAAADVVRAVIDIEYVTGTATLPQRATQLAVTLENKHGSL